MKANNHLTRAVLFLILSAVGSWLVFSGYSDPTVHNENVYGWLTVLGFIMFVAGVVGLLILVTKVFPKKNL